MFFAKNNLNKLLINYGGIWIDGKFERNSSMTVFPGQMLKIKRKKKSLQVLAKLQLLMLLELQK